MFSKLNSFLVFFVLILAASIISFSGSYNSETTNNPAITNTNTTDIDNFIVQNFTGGGVTYQTVMPFVTSVNSPFLFVLPDTLILPANPGPSNNGGSPGWAMFLDLVAGPRDIYFTQMKTASTGTPAQSFTVEVFIRSGTSLGGPVGSGPGSSTAGWTSIGVVPVVQGSVTSGISEVFTVPAITVPAHDTVGIALKFNVVGPRYFGTGTPPISYYSDTNLTLATGEARSAPFTPTGSWFSSRALTGEIRYVVSSTTGLINLGTGIPKGFRLAQNYPNPFNPSTTIEFAIPRKSNVTLTVYDAKGQVVSILINGEYQPGTYSISWNASSLASGIYFYRLIADNYSQTKKLTLIK